VAAGAEVPAMSDEAKATRSYDQVLRLNQELVHDLQGLIDDHESKLEQLAQLREAEQRGREEIARLEEELKRAQAREDDLRSRLQQLESERVDQLTAVSAHLDALRSALERYLHQSDSLEKAA
jgi:predicted nuclease with TOPRIM domain